MQRIRDCSPGCVRRPDQPHQVTLGIQRIDISEQGGKPVLFFRRLKDIHHSLSEFHIRAGAGLLHDGIHPSLDKYYLRESLFQLFIYISKVASHKVMETDGKYKDSFGKSFLSPLSADLFQYISDSFQCDLLEISAVHILFFKDYTGKALNGVHLGGSQHDTSHTIVRADVDLMGLGHQHSDMHDVPGLVDRRVKFKFLRERRGKRGF